MEVKKRNPFIALLFSIVAPGLGQIYNGQLKKGIIFFIIGLLLLLSLSVVGLYFYGITILIGIIISWFIFASIDSLITANKLQNIKLNFYNNWQSYLIFITISIISCSIIKHFFVTIKAYSIPATSMQNTLLVKDYLIADNAAYGLRNPFNDKVWISFGKPRRGDVAIFIFPQDPTKDYIKRVIGLPGDRVQIIDKKVYINGAPYEIPQAGSTNAVVLPASQSPRDNYGPVVVPKDQYFFLGDYRDQSYDSRFWGFVPFDLIRGKALYVYFSWDEENSRIRWERIGLSIN